MVGRVLLRLHGDVGDGFVSEGNGKGRRLSIEEMLRAPDLREREVPLPSGRGTVVVRSMTKEAEVRARSYNADEDGSQKQWDLEFGLFRGGLGHLLSEEQIETVWRSWPSADINAVITAVSELNSDMEVRDAMVAFHGEPGPQE